MLLRSKEDGELYDVYSTESYTEDFVYEYARHDGSSKYNRRTGYESLKQFGQYWEDPDAKPEKKTNKVLTTCFGLMAAFCVTVSAFLIFILTDDSKVTQLNSYNAKEYSYCFENDNYVKGLEANNPNMEDSRLAELKAEYYLRCVNEGKENNE